MAQDLLLIFTPKSEVATPALSLPHSPSLTTPFQLPGKPSVGNVFRGAAISAI